MATREDQRREHNEQKELESLRRVFESLDRTKCGKIGFKELNDQLIKLEYRAKRVEVEDMIWEVDEDCDHAVSWDEFKLMFHRCRNDRTGLEPRKLFNVVEFMMHDKDSSGTIDMDECMEILFRRFGKEQVRLSPSSLRPLAHPLRPLAQPLRPLAQPLRPLAQPLSCALPACLAGSPRLGALARPGVRVTA